MVLDKFKAFWADRKEDRRLIRVLKEGKTTPFLFDQADNQQEQEWYSKEELAWMGIKVTRNKTLVKMLADDIAAEYSYLQRVKEKESANFAVLVFFNYATKTSVYRKYVKLADGAWRTLDIFRRVIKEDLTKIEKSERILLFKI